MQNQEIIGKKSFAQLIFALIWLILITIFLLLPNTFHIIVIIFIYLILIVLIIEIILLTLRPLNIIIKSEDNFVVRKLFKTQVINFKEIQKIDFYKTTRPGIELTKGTIIIVLKDNKKIKIIEVTKVIDVYLKMDCVFEDYLMNK
mgnify:CR=1 FL=1